MNFRGLAESLPQDERDARLEMEIDVVFAKLRGASQAQSQAQSQDLLTQAAVLIRRRTPTAQLLAELRHRARA